jgi:hypothetical protein
MKRTSGYYWVKYEGSWTVAQYKDNAYWWVLTFQTDFEDDEFDEINEDRILTPEEIQECAEVVDTIVAAFPPEEYDIHIG